MTYNGWPNWQTWELVNHGVTELFENSSTTYPDLYALKEAIQESAWDLVFGDEEPSLLRAFAENTFEKVDFYHLADQIIEDNPSILSTWAPDEEEEDANE